MATLITRERVTRRLRPLLGTYVEVAAHDAGDEAIEHAFHAMNEVQRALSFQDPNSDLSRLNASNGEWIDMPRDAIHVLRLARAMMRASGGLFDCTVGARRKSAASASDIEIRGHAVLLRRRLRLTVDGIAKGYAVDLGIRALKKSGVRAGWINAGGDMRAFGSITLPVQRREADGSLRALGGLHDAAVATSAVTVRRSSRFPGAIVGPSGRRADPGVWTVVARRAWRADALTKVAALARGDERTALLAKLGGRLVVHMGFPRSRPSDDCLVAAEEVAA